MCDAVSVITPFGKMHSYTIQSQTAALIALESSIKAVFIARCIKSLQSPQDHIHRATIVCAGQMTNL